MNSSLTYDNSIQDRELTCTVYISPEVSDMHFQNHISFFFSYIRTCKLEKKISAGVYARDQLINCVSDYTFGVLTPSPSFSQCTHNLERKIFALYYYIQVQTTIYQIHQISIFMKLFLTNIVVSFSKTSNSSICNERDSLRLEPDPCVRFHEKWSSPTVIPLLKKRQSLKYMVIIVGSNSVRHSLRT